ncbi:MAG: hypothetical protein OEN02_16530 [Gammaproteobacteria bacterium]|nr:hypothetical protein [Gammaproteobacteria bacterium]MDH3535221.1 hypothetical protein [Gammaproteobacteria bacterium]
MKPDTSESRRVVALALLMLAYLAGCSESTNSSTATAPVDAVQAQTTAPVETVSALPARNTGTVMSNQMAGGYSYLEVDIDGAVFWLATSMSGAKPGDRIAWRDHAVMTNFKSKALGREFGQILFVDRVMAATEAATQAHRGTVVESMSAAGYSYIRVEENGASVWLAAPETTVEIGQSILWSGGTPMRNFNSRSLDRNFDEIIFVSAVQGS